MRQPSTQLRAAVTTTDTEVHAELLRHTLEHAPGKPNEFTKEKFHQYLSYCLVRLLAARSPVAIEHCESLLARFPDKCEMVCQYLLALSDSKPAEVANAIEGFLVSDAFMTGWQEAWATRILTKIPGTISAHMKHHLRAVMGDADRNWLSRAEAAAALGACRSLEQRPFILLWRTAPPPVRPDLARAAALARGAADWAKKFLGALRPDPLMSPLIDHLEATIPET